MAQPDRPLHAPSEHADPVVAGHARQAQARRVVLIIDDDPVFAILASETLEQAGYDPKVADTAGAAVEAFQRENPDLVLLDVDLPGGNGFEICATLRSLSARSDVPIVMVTGHDDTHSIAQAYEAGATDFIQKPVLWPTLPHRVSFMLRAVDNLRALRTSEQKNRALVEALPDAIFVVNAQGQVSDHITGNRKSSSTKMVGRSLEQAFPPELARAARAALSAPIGKRLATHEFGVGKGDDKRWLEARLRPQADGPLLIVVRDTTERHRAKAHIEYLAYYDVLTKLPNRQLFVRDAARAIEKARETSTGLALLYVDLDRFKRINDNLGHSVGDELLQHVARRLERGVRDPEDRGAEGVLPEGARIARLGGDEFVVLLAGIGDEAKAGAVAERLQRIVGEPIECAGHRFVVTPSVGIALFPSDATDIDGLLAKADMAMYQAKERGRNGHAFFGQSMAIRSLGHLELETDLHRALDNGGFEVHYQPKIDLVTGEIVGAEALLRWQHAERGWIGPDKFIPVAEETGLIVPLGEWVLGEACRQLRSWAEQDMGNLTIAVNVSVHQFSRSDFLDRVLGLLAESGVDPKRLELEITESILMKNIAETTDCLRRLRAAGISVAVDDFGTGFSSLGYLRHFPIDALKIDRSFVTDLQQSDDAAAICAAIIAMARELKLRVVAEGVETPAQLEFLRSHRCDQAQGYLISRPVPIRDLQRRLRNVPGPDATRSCVALGDPLSHL